MTKVSMFKSLIKLFLIAFFALFSPAYATNKTFVSLTPVTTEIMYAIGAQNSLIGVSTMCNYPKEAQTKEKIGNNFFINKEKIIKLNPNYILTIDSAQPLLAEFKYTKIKPLFFRFSTIEDVYKNILQMGVLTNNEQNAKNVVASIQKKVSVYKAPNQKKILYLVQPDPMITVGQNSFIASVIKQSGHICVTSGLKNDYPVISKEFALKQQPDIVILTFKTNLSEVKKLFPGTKIVVLTDEQRDILNRPGPRIYKGVQFFSKL